VRNTLAAQPGDVLVLGAAGKMGPTLARMTRRALDEIGQNSRRVIAVARFSDPSARERMEADGIETIRCDLSDRAEIARLPDMPNVLFLAGQKFGTTGAPDLTWMMNTVVPAYVAERFCNGPGSRIVAFSTGCVYANAPVAQGGSLESDR
jgi:nucleoside-diphosphate-sugar epimerase